MRKTKEKRTFIMSIVAIVMVLALLSLAVPLLFSPAAFADEGSDGAAEVYVSAVPDPVPDSALNSPKPVPGTGDKYIFMLVGLLGVGVIACFTGSYAQKKRENHG